MAGLTIFAIHNPPDYEMIRELMSLY